MNDQINVEPLRLMMIIASKEVEISFLREKIQMLSAELTKKDQKESKEDAGKHVNG